MTGTKLCARAHRERNVALTSTWFSHKLVLIDDRHDAARTELEKIVIDFAKDRFGQAVFEVHGAVRMNEIVFVVVAKERSETEAFDVEVCVAEKAGSDRAEGGSYAVTAITGGIHRDDLVVRDFFAGCKCAQREF